MAPTCLFLALFVFHAAALFSVQSWTTPATAVSTGHTLIGCIGSYQNSVLNSHLFSGLVPQILYAAQTPSRLYFLVSSSIPGNSSVLELFQSFYNADFCWSEPNQRYINQTSGIQTEGVDAGLDRLDQRKSNPDGTYAYAASGEGVLIFMIDTGIYVGHSDFQGRATWGANFIGDGIDTDCSGHGTHTSSLAAGATLGTSKSPLLKAVKVLGCDGGGTTWSVVLGLQWVTTTYCQTDTSRRIVLSMSFRGGSSPAINDALAFLTTGLAGCQAIAVAAAGNDGSDNCDTSPAGAPGVFTVASSSPSDTLSYFSTYGNCVSIAAPGENILGAGISGPTASIRLSGTSMACPFIAGLIANMYELLGRTPSTQDIIDGLLVRATQNKILTPTGKKLPLGYSGADIGHSQKRKIGFPALAIMLYFLL